MDGIHDLGGKEGFGPVKPQFDYIPFETTWEGRMWALCQTIDAPDWTIDWFRHLIELLDPADYLTLSYFEKWYMSFATGMVMSGVFSEEELKSGKASVSAPPAENVPLKEVLETERGFCWSFEREIEEEPAFSAGDMVRTVRHGHPGHFRLPAYAQDREGEIVTRRGAHVLPDSNVKNIEAPQHLYTVKFTARELWGPDASPIDTVLIDAWESYLVHA